MSSNFPLLQSIKTVIVQPIIGLLFAVALMYFLWGMYEYFKGSANTDHIKAAQEKMIWGVVGLFIMSAAIGIVNLICATLQC